MSSLSARQFMEMLVEQCPCYDQPLPDCPLSALRAEPEVAVRKERLAAMSEPEVEEIYQRHLACVRRVCGG